MEYHLNRKTGETGECHATKKVCPLGIENHFKTLAEAEAKQAELFLNTTKPLKKVRNVSPLLSETVDVEKFNQLLKDGYIMSSENPDDKNMKVFCYTSKTQFSGTWTPETTLARGLVLNTHGDDSLKHATIEARGLRKFFTVDQTNSDWGSIKLYDDDEGVKVSEPIKIEPDSPATVANKLDGSLGVMYVAPDGSAKVATKGSFKSDAANEGNRILTEKHHAKELGQYLKQHHPNETPLFEIISPKAEHVVQYGDKDDTVFLGFINKRTGEWSPSDENSEMAKRFGFETPKRYPSRNLTEAMKQSYDPNHEGLVITVHNHDGSQSMFKVKYPEFFQLRKIRYAATPKALNELVSKTPAHKLLSVRSSKDVDLSDFLPKNAPKKESQMLISHRQEDIFHNVIEPLQKNTARISEEYKKITENFDLNTPGADREFAQKVAKNPDKGFLFAMKSAHKKGQNPEEKVAELLKLKVLKTF